MPHTTHTTTPVLYSQHILINRLQFPTAQFDLIHLSFVMNALVLFFFPFFSFSFSSSSSSLFDRSCIYQPHHHNPFCICHTLSSSLIQVSRRKKLQTKIFVCK
ncbi:hypothetical protein P168DRAFT_26580 [Aspergillus campestris IBT 28561]|uniref:Transmembrane protein n=1 Tax=Aspergillus campestris (strain IBT 28561) TaxID=1392248 RepID=A0A2I1DGC7_ASPC2|nr:uncharacterized protein P168DRAFT_26580 [Aspergillus campestris IBT 28561]PKY08927.1 hypothetical protein P168DRAFT_26580 [Aspergillus campestris IBT 28561]